jgi:Domain of unknown function (DUF4401)
MSGSNLAAFAELLRARGVIAADAPAPPEELQDRPWFIALLQGFAGWLAGVLLLVFIAVAFHPDGRGAFAALGAVLLASGWAIYRADPDAVFLDQLALALSIAGQMALVFGIAGENATALGFSVTALILQLLVLAFMPNRTARTLAALFASVAWMYTIHFALRSGDVDDLFFGGRYDDRALGLWTLPLGWLITWAPLVVGVIVLIRREPQWMSGWLSTHARSVLTGLLLTLGLGGVVTEPFMWLTLGSDAWGVGFSWFALFPLLSIALSMLAAYGAFRLRSHGLLGVAILGALMHLSRFYYLYGTTLITKSLIMLCVGAALLAAGFWLHRRLLPGEAT